MREQLAKIVAKGKLSTDDVEEMLNQCIISNHLTDMLSCDIVIEAIIEKREPKEELFRLLEKILMNDTIIATNTSSISISQLALGLKHPERFVGIHFFNPAHIMKLIEVIPGAKTSENTLRSTYAFIQQLGKTAVLAKDVPGFIVNRVARNFYNESLRIVQEQVADVETVDKLITAQGFKMGPFELMDLIGVDTNFAVTTSIWEQYFYDPRYAPSTLQREYVMAGKHGIKTGEGFYRYNPDGSKVGVTEEVDEE
jgi:3-hydroxybutyryl-CoA dehydrogenase